MNKAKIAKKVFMQEIRKEVLKKVGNTKECVIKDCGLRATAGPYCNAHYIKYNVNPLKVQSNRGIQKVYGGKFAAAAMVNGLSIYLGTYGTKEEAGKAYNRAVAKLHGEKAVLNEFGL